MQVFARAACFVVATSAVAMASFLHGRAPGITYSTEGLRATELVREIGPKLGLDLKVSKELSNEFLVVRLVNVPASEVLKRIAQATHAEWRHQGASVILERSEVDRHQLASLEQGAVLKIIQDGQEDIASDITDKGEFTAESAQSLAGKFRTLLSGDTRQNRNMRAQSRVLGENTPMGRALVKLGTGLSAQELSEIQIRIRTVWSTAPTSLQRPLGRLGDSVLSALVGEQRLWSQAIGDSLSATNNPEQRIMRGMRLRDSFDTQPFEPTGLKLLFSAYRENPRSGVGIQLEVRDRNGTTLAQTSGYLLKDPVEEGERKPDDPEVKFSESLRPFYPFFGQRAPGSSMPASVRDKFLHPDRFDPLLMGPGPTLLAVAEAKNVDAVFDVPDGAFSSMSYRQPDQPLGARQLLRTTTDAMTFKEDGQWLIGWATMPVTDAADRADRAVLAKFLQFKASGEKETLEQRCAFALALPDMNECYLAAELVAPFEDPMKNLFDQERLMRLYASLTEAERDAAKGDGIRLADLNDTAKGYVDQVIFGRQSRLAHFVSAATAVSVPQGYTFRGSSGVDPTEAFPTGIPSDAYLKIGDSWSDNVANVTDLDLKGPFPPRLLDAQLLAQEIVQPSEEKRNVNGVQSSAMLDGKNLLFIRQRTLTFNFYFANAYKIENLQMNDLEVSGGPVQDYTGLPADFKKAVEDAIDKLKSGRG